MTNALVDPAAVAGLDAKELGVAAEPVQLRAEYRRLALESPAGWRSMTADGSWVADALWPRWGPVLVDTNVSREKLAAVARGYQLELWLWLMGERTWAQAASGLAGRIQRRAVS